MQHVHTFVATQEGPIAEVTSLTITHESPRKPTRRERILDFLLFWRPTPRRVNRIEMVFPAIEFATLDRSHGPDGRVTMTGTFIAHAPGNPVLHIVDPDEQSTPAPTIDLKSFLRS